MTDIPLKPIAVVDITVIDPNMPVDDDQQIMLYLPFTGKKLMTEDQREHVNKLINDWEKVQLQKHVLATKITDYMREIGYKTVTAMETHTFTLDP
jgi:hypothetical protein